MRRSHVMVLAAMLVGLMAAPAWAGSNVWTESGPTGGPIRAILIDPSAPDTIYVGTLGSGVFMSTDGGDSWTARGLAGLKIRALVRDPAVPVTLYAAVEND